MKKKAKLIFKHNSFDVIEEGDYVICAISGKEIMLKDLNYWNVDLQEAYFHQEKLMRDLKILKSENLLPSIMRPDPFVGIV